MNRLLPCAKLGIAVRTVEATVLFSVYNVHIYIRYVFYVRYTEHMTFRYGEVSNFVTESPKVG